MKQNLVAGQCICFTANYNKVPESMALYWLKVAVVFTAVLTFEHHYSRAVTSHCKNGVTYVVFALESSHAVDELSFQRMKEFVINFTGSIKNEISPSIVRIAVIEYATVPEVVIHFTDLLFAGQIKRAVESIRYSGGDSNVDSALTLVRTFMMAGLDSWVSKITVMLTGGQWNHPNETVFEASLLRESGVQVIAVGVANATADTLSDVSGDTNKVGFINTAEEWNRVQSMLVTMTCQKVALWKKVVTENAGRKKPMKRQKRCGPYPVTCTDPTARPGYELCSCASSYYPIYCPCTHSISYGGGTYEIRSLSSRSGSGSNTQSPGLQVSNTLLPT